MADLSECLISPIIAILARKKTIWTLNTNLNLQEGYLSYMGFVTAQGLLNLLIFDIEM